MTAVNTPNIFPDETLNLWKIRFMYLNNELHPSLSNMLDTGYPAVYYKSDDPSSIFEWLHDNLHILDYEHYTFMTHGAVVFSSVAACISFKMTFIDNITIET